MKIPSSRLLQFRQALQLMIVGRNIESKAQIDKLVKFYPRNVWLNQCKNIIDNEVSTDHTLRGLQYLEVNNIKKARNNFEKAISLNHDNSVASNNLDSL